MSRIICEVCGTSYPDTAAQCPICGCVKAAGKQTVAGDTELKKPENKKTTNHVRGGRYSKANVRKRNKANHVKPASYDRKKEPDDRSNRGLVILAVILLLAIIAVLAYIAIRFWGPEWKPGGKPTTAATTQTTVSTVPSTTADTTPDLRCTDLTLSVNVVELEAKGQSWLLNVKTEPENTTDPVRYITSDDSVAMVTEQGKVVAIGPGQAIITISCGEVEKNCRIVCAFQEETQPTETTATTDTTAPTEEDEKLELNREDITFSRQGEEWQLYSGPIAKPLITWSTGDASIARVENGKVVAVGPGTTTVYAEYNGQKDSCIIRCSFSVESTSDGGGFNTGISEDGGAEG